MSVTLPAEHIADTAFLTAFCRALETDRTNGHFRDPFAKTLAGTRGERLLKSWPRWETTAAGCIVRTYLIDRMLLQTVEECDIDTVVNLGAGLDTRAFRLPLPPELSWIEVDDPRVLSYKAARLATNRPACTLKSVPLDLADRLASRNFLSA